MINKALLAEFEQLLLENLEKANFPCVRGNSIRIGAMIVRSNKRGHLVYNTNGNVQVASMFSKAAAVALARTMADGKDHLKKIREIDDDIAKYYSEAIFYKHNLDRTTDEFRRCVLETRYDIAKAHTSEAKYRLDSYIFD